MSSQESGDTRFARPIASSQLTRLLVDKLSNDQRARWESGERPEVEVYLEQYPALQADPDAAVDLIYDEVLFREARGEVVQLNEYLERFPQWAAQLRDQFEIHEALRSDDLAPGFGIQQSLIAVRLDPSSLASPVVLPSIPGYEIEGELGRGGMGIVYRARQLSLKRPVALKMLGNGAEALPQALERFRSEAEAVARLQHPHIVQIYEVGEHAGRPYLALELVEGGNLAERLAAQPQAPRPAALVVRTLAQAIHTAHEGGIVHRDLKPANILLAGGPDTPLEDCTPKIADFGLAKCLDGEKTLTQSGNILGTPSYMAPEQARGMTTLIGPSTDIYALGALLYELLTGQPPFRGETRLNTLLQLLTDEPRPPRHWQPGLPRDLETICLKCLAKLPRQRYPSAQALAEDLERFLAGEPIHARPTGAWEQAVKWMKRRPLAASLVGISSVAVFALLLVSLAYSSRLRWYNEELRTALQNAQEQREEAEHARREAEDNFQKAMRAVGELSTLLADKDLAQAPHLERKRQVFLQKALTFYQVFLQTKSTSPVVRQKTAEAYGRVAAIHDLLGEYDRAEQAYRQAVDLHQRLVAEAPDRADYRHQLARIVHSLGSLLQNRRQFAEAESLYRQALTLDQALATASPGVAGYRYMLARHYHNLGTLLRDTNRRTEAEAAYHESIKLDEQLATRFPKVPEYRQELAKGKHHLAHFRAAFEPEKTRREYLEVLEIQKQLVADFPDVPGYRHEFARTYHSLGELLRSLKESLEAVAAYRQALVLHQKLAADFPGVPSYRRELAGHYYGLGLVHKSLGQFTEAAAAFGQVLILGQKLVAEAPGDAAERQRLARTYSNLGWLTQRAGQTSEAEKAYHQALALQQQLAADYPGRPDFQRELERIQQRLRLLGKGRSEESRRAESGIGDREESWTFRECDACCRIP
jgi:serine/threonine protein kinase/Tfp pilus assembly protein PilF